MELKQTDMKLTKLFAVALCAVLLASCGKSGFETVGVAKFKEIIKDPSIALVDVRTPAEYTEGHIENAMNLNVWDSLFVENAMNAIPQGKRVAVYCKSGKRRGSVESCTSRLCACRNLIATMFIRCASGRRRNHTGGLCPKTSGRGTWEVA